MVLKLYGSPTSTCTKRVATILYLKKIPHELIAIDLAKKEHKDAAYMEKQPFGQVPYIDDDGLILFESRAICRYLEEKYPDHGPTFIPKDAKGKAMFEQAASIEMMTFDPCASKAGYEGFIKKRLGLPTSQAVFDEAVSMLSTKLDGYEKILSKQKYLAGDELSQADLWHLPYGSLIAASGNDLMTTKSPSVTRWWNSLISLPTWQNLHMAVPVGVQNFD